MLDGNCAPVLVPPSSIPVRPPRILFFVLAPRRVYIANEKAQSRYSRLLGRVRTCRESVIIRGSLSDKEILSSASLSRPLSLSSLPFFSLFSSPSISLSFDRLLRLSEFGRAEILFPSLTPPSCPANNYFPRRSLSNPTSKLSIFGAVSISEDVRGRWFFSWPSSPRIREYFSRKRMWHPPISMAAPRMAKHARPTTSS